MATVVAIVMGAAFWEDTQHPGMELRLDLRAFRYSIDTATTLAQLQYKPGVHNSAAPGITLGAVLTNLQYRVQARTTLSGRHTLSVMMGYRPATLFVAQEMTRDRCTYRHVLDHESKHIAIYEEETSRWRKELEQFAAAAAAKDYSADQLERGAVRLVVELDSRVYARHRLLDNPTEYAENLTACGGNVRRLAYGEAAIAVPDHVTLEPVTITGHRPTQLKTLDTQAVNVANALVARG